MFALKLYLWVFVQEESCKGDNRVFYNPNSKITKKLLNGRYQQGIEEFTLVRICIQRYNDWAISLLQLFMYREVVSTSHNTLVYACSWIQLIYRNFLTFLWYFHCKVFRLHSVIIFHWIKFTFSLLFKVLVGIPWYLCLLLVLTSFLLFFFSPQLAYRWKQLKFHPQFSFSIDSMK